MAILVVVLGHYASGILPGVGFFDYAAMGVDVFFVLSGFLIGGAILDGAGREGFLVWFFRRRSARILPLYFSVLAAVFILHGLIGGAPWGDQLFPAWTYVTFTMNNWSAYYLNEASPLLSPAWSLSVEEKFYLLAPLLLPLVPRRKLPWVLGLACLAAIFFRYLSRGDIYSMELVLPARMDSLLIGVGVAYVQRHVDLKRASAWLPTAMLALPLIYVPVLMLLDGKQFLLAHTAFALITATYMVSVLSAPPRQSPFCNRGLVFLAHISFGVYLIHQPVNVFLTGLLLGKSVYMPGLDRIWVTLLSLGVTLGLAVLSRRYLEEPVMNWERRTAQASARVPAAARSAPVLALEQGV